MKKCACTYVPGGDSGSILPTDIAHTVELSRRLLEILQKAGPECEEELKKLREELCAARKPTSMPILKKKLNLNILFIS